VPYYTQDTWRCWSIFPAIFCHILLSSAYYSNVRAMCGNMRQYAVCCYTQCSAIFCQASAIFCQGRIVQSRWNVVGTGGRAQGVTGWSRDRSVPSVSSGGSATFVDRNGAVRDLVGLLRRWDRALRTVASLCVFNDSSLSAGVSLASSSFWSRSISALAAVSSS